MGEGRASMADGSPRQGSCRWSDCRTERNDCRSNHVWRAQHRKVTMRMSRSLIFLRDERFVGWAKAQRAKARAPCPRV
jgi:hypothetical protein